MATTEAYVPPQNLEAEESVLGAMMVSESAVDSVLVDIRLAEEDFYRNPHRLVFRAIRSLQESSSPVDALTVTEQLTQLGELAEAGGKETVSSLASSVPVAGNAAHYAKIVKANAMLRRLLAASQRIQKSVHEREAEPRDLVEQAERAMFEVAHDTAAKDFQSLTEILIRETHRLEELVEGRRELTGTPSGFIDLDSLTGGFQPGNLIIIAARPSIGKSALVANIADHVGVDKKEPVAFFSLEMSDAELAHRFLACRARIPGDKLRKGQVKQLWPKVLKASNQLENAPIWIDTSSDLSVLELRAKARRLASSNGGKLGLIIVDYLQLMRPDDPRQSRVEQVGHFSRGLKLLARELDVPVIGLSQLSRAPEQRPDKKPMLSDLRESGCVTGESLVYLPDAGAFEPIESLVGKSGFRVLAVDPTSWKLEPRKVTRAFATGVKPVFRLRTQLGREVKATGNHKFLTLEGWRRLDELEPGERLALPRRLPDPGGQSMSGAELALLGHLIGDGCTLPRHAIQYTTNDRRLAKLVADLAVEVFGSGVRPRIKREHDKKRGRSWFQVYLPSSQRLTHGKSNPIAAWLRKLDAFGWRSHEKRVPDAVFAQSSEGIARFLCHLWATDGSVWLQRSPSLDRFHPRVYYASSSARLSRDVQALLLRLGINARRFVAAEYKGRSQFHVVVSGGADLRVFMERIGGIGESKEPQAKAILRWLDEHPPNTNRDVVPIEAWSQVVRPALVASGMTHRRFQAGLGTAYCGSTLFKSALSRERAARVAEVLRSDEVARLADSDVYWDRIESIEPAGEEPVYDLTVDGLHNFVANEIVVHNSIEQDADLVAFIFRQEYYEPDNEEVRGKAELIVAKHRNGPIGNVELAFQHMYPRFMNLARADRERPQRSGPPVDPDEGFTEIADDD